MATERIDIVVNERGARTVRREIDKIGDTADSTSGALDMLKRALGALGVGLLAREALRMADAYTTIQNRLRTVTNGAQELKLVTDQLFEISKATRQSFEGTAEVYARVGLASKDLGVSQLELLNFTKSLNQAVALSGASAEEAKAGMIQLSQGLASGALRGDELRSVLESLPVVADVIADSLGVTRGELRDLGKDGAITAEIVLRAFREAREELEGRFAKSIPTVNQAMGVLRDSIMQYLGELDQSLGLTRKMAGVLLVLADNIDTLARAFAAAAITIGVVFAQKAVGFAIAQVNRLTLAIAANPLGALLVAVTAGISLLITFADKISIGEGRIAHLGDLAAVVWSDIKAGIGAVADFFGDRFGWIADLAEAVFGEVEFSLEGVLVTAGFVVDRFIGLWVGAYKAIVAAFENLPAAFRDIFTRALNGAVGLVEGGVNKIVGAIDFLLEGAGLDTIGEVTLARAENTAAGAAAGLGSAVKDAFLEGFNASVLEDSIRADFDRADERARKRLAEEQRKQDELDAARRALSNSGTNNTSKDSSGSGGTTFDELMAQLRQQGQLLQLNNQERRIQEGLLDAQEELERKLTVAEADLLEKQLRLNESFEDRSTLQYEILPALEREAELLRLNSREREVQMALLGLEDQLLGKLTDSERLLLQQKLELNQELAEEARLLDRILGPMEALQFRQDTLNRLFEKGRISVEQYRTELEKLALLQAEGDNSLTGGLEAGLRRVAAQTEDFGKGISDVVVGAFDEATNAVVQFAKTGEFNMRQFFGSIAEQLLQLATQQLFAQLLGSFLPGAPIAGGFMSQLPGYKTGGSFTVGGAGGPDSKLVAFKATPGERVDVSTPGQQKNQQQDQRPMNVTVINQVDPRESLAALETAEGEQVIINTIERNPDTVRRLLGAN